MLDLLPFSLAKHIMPPGVLDMIEFTSVYYFRDEWISDVLTDSRQFVRKFSRCLITTGLLK